MITEHLVGGARLKSLQGVPIASLEALMTNPISSVTRSSQVEQADQAQPAQRTSQTDRKHQSQASKRTSSTANQDKVTLSRNQTAKQNRSQR
jgi:hypothetical protein